MSVLLTYRNAEERPKCFVIYWCLGISDLGRTSPAVPGRQCASHFTKPVPLRRPLATPHGYDTRLRAGYALQAALQACRAPCHIKHAPCGRHQRSLVSTS